MKPNLREKIDYYYNENGYLVFTEQYHLTKGYCCGEGCTHCPFNYVNVPEPQRTLLIEKR